MEAYFLAARYFSSSSSSIFGASGFPGIGLYFPMKSKFILFFISSTFSFSSWTTDCLICFGEGGFWAGAGCLTGNAGMPAF